MSDKIKLRYKGVIVDYLNHKSSCIQMKLKIPGDQVASSTKMILFLNGKEFTIRSRKVKYGKWILHYLKVLDDGSADLVVRTFAEDLGPINHVELEKDQEEAVDIIIKEV